MTKKEFDPKMRKLQTQLNVSSPEEAFETLDKMFALINRGTRFKINEIDKEYYYLFIRQGLPSHEQIWNDKIYSNR